MNLNEKISFLLDGINTPFETKKEIFSFLDKIAHSEDRKKKLENIINKYDSKEVDYNSILNEFHIFVSDVKIKEYEANSVLLCLLFSNLFEIYKYNNLPESLFWDTAKDINYKLKECQLVKGCAGIFVMSWYVDFFRLNTFAFGRLQFQRSIAEFDYDNICSNSLAISIHIPRTETRLEDDEVQNSIDRAYEFFKGEFKDEKVLFKLHSWLLFEENRNMLKPDSNIVKFMNRFTLVKTEFNNDYSELWRIFDTEYKGLESLNGNSSLRRGYINLVKDGKKIGEGLGFFVK